MKLAKKGIALCLAASLSFHASSAAAGEVEEAAAKAFASAYAKEQLKHQLAQYLNKNPQVIFSASSTIGTQSMRFLSQALGAYGLITAKTDKERLWSATYLILSPEPTTALILFAAQMADTLITMKQQRDLARRYEKIAEIQAQTINVLMKLAVHDINSQLSVLSRFDRALSEIAKLEKELLVDQVYLVLKSDIGTTPSLTNAADIELSLTRLSRLDSALLELEIASICLAKTVDAERLSLGTEFVADCLAANRSYDVLRMKYEDLKASFFYFFASLDARALKTQVTRDLQPYSTEVRVYRRCVEVFNAAQTDTFFNLDDDLRLNVSRDELANCTNRFSIGKK